MLYLFDEINSTQDKLKELYRAHTASFGDAVLAQKQTQGRGRFGRQFFSPPKTGIYLSILLPFNDTHLLTIAAGLAVSKCIQETSGIQAGIKWVNDLYLNGKKIAGILAEAITNEEGVLSAVILGVGINIAYPPGDFPQEIKETAGVLFAEPSLDLPPGHTTESMMKIITENLIEHLNQLPKQMQSKAFIKEYKELLINPQDVPEGALD